MYSATAVTHMTMNAAGTWSAVEALDISAFHFGTNCLERTCACRLNLKAL
jgi:hypothetical protein